MDDNITNGADYTQGFNEGYIIAKHIPELAEQLSNVKTESVRMEGFRDGREEFIQEKMKDRLPTWLNRDFSKTTHTPDKTKEDKGLDKE